MKYWNIHEILPYQRNFNLINGERSIGKTYGTEKWTIDKCLTRKRQFMYIVRTQSEKQEGVFKQAFEKLERQEFGDVEFDWDKEVVTINKDIGGWCIALSESQKIKKRSFPQVDYFIFDEYMLEESSKSAYVSGFKEPDLLLSLYQTVDRDEDRVKVFMLGNNTSFFNPYHLHPAFNIQPVKKGGIWTSKNVLYQWATATEDVKNKKKQSKFSQMIEDTRYGEYATDGNYIEDNSAFIDTHGGKSRYLCTVIVNGIRLGIYIDMQKGLMYVSEKVDPSCPLEYALTLEDHSENVLLTKARTACIDGISRAVKTGTLRYESMLIKKVCEKAMYMLL